jgi:hypothetical protein
MVTLGGIGLIARAFTHAPMWQGWLGPDRWR